MKETIVHWFYDSPLFRNTEKGENNEKQKKQWEKEKQWGEGKLGEYIFIQRYGAREDSRLAMSVVTERL